MKRNLIILLFTIIIVAGCKNRASNGDDWVKDPIKDWPQIALTNEVEFDTKLYTDFAAGFLVNTGQDTLAIASKQLFIAFVGVGIKTVDFQGKLKIWAMYPRNNPKERIILDQLINTNPSEFSAMPGSTNNADWLIFSIKENHSKVKPLKIATKPLENGQVLYVIGWPDDDQRSKPEILAGAIIKLFDNQIFIEMQNELENPEGYMGSPVFNKSGEVVGIYSGQNGTIGRSCTVTYLMDVLSEPKLN